MSEVEKVTCFPNEGTPVVIPGVPGYMDIVRVIGTGKYYRYNPDALVPTSPPDAELNRKQLRALIIAAFGGNGAATAKLQTYIDVAVANVGTTQADKNMRYALESLRTDDRFAKDEATQLMLGMQFSAQDRNAVLTAWPKV